MNSLDETVAAVSTPRGKGGVAVIRISGPDAIVVAGRMFQPRYGKKWNNDLSLAPVRNAIYGTILDSDDRPVDEGLCTVFRGPASFTGEDMVEFSCHGGLAVTEEVCLSAYAHGAKPAERGAFTRRAFLNGKLSLTESEAVGQLIDADTRERLALSGGAIRGNVSREIASLADSLLGTMTALYAAIDYPEEDVGDEGEREIADTLRRTRDGVNRLLATYKTGRAVAEGVKTVIAGRPNAGKSSLFNRIVGAESAIVTDVAGTTRDVLRETASFGGVTLRLSDTAGLHTSEDAVEKIGIDRAERELDDAELILALFDGSSPLDDGEDELLARLKTLPAAKIVVISKTDLGVALTAEERAKLAESADEVVEVSAKTSDGLDALSAAVSRLYGSDRIQLSSDAVIWDVRHRELLSRSQRCLNSAIAGIESGAPLDAVCTDAEMALAALTETDGRGIDETIVDEIFKRFCVGK